MLLNQRRRFHPFSSIDRQPSQALAPDRYLEKSVEVADPKQPAGTRMFVLDLVPLAALPQPVTLASLKSDSEFADSPLVRQGRLSVVRLSAAQARRIEELGGAR